MKGSSLAGLCAGLLATALVAGAHAGVTASVPVNINKASAEEIAESLNGVGLKTAREIVAFRDKHGPFKSVEQLADVKGVGEKTVEKLKPSIRLQ